MGKKSVLSIPYAPVARILTKAGAKRVSQEAVEAFTEVLLKRAEDISQHAIAIARHTGRKTVHEGDIKLASKR